MKLLHLGDLHLGKSLGEFDLYDDQKFILDQILNIVSKESVDGVLIAGDVYDRAIPSEAATSLLDYFLSAFAKAGVSVFMISGNHDSDERLNFGSSIFEAKDLFISSKYNGRLYKKTITDNRGNINIFLLPFVKASTVKHYFPDADISSYDDAVRVIIDHADIDPNERNVIVAHQFVVDGVNNPIFGGSESLATKTVGLVERINSDCFDVFDYAALGHIHSAQAVGREEVRYSGSPLKYSLSEVNSDKSVPIITFNEKGKVDIKLVPLIPMRNLRHIKGSIKNLLDKDNITEPQDFIFVTLTDEDVVNDAMGIFQQYYPNTVKIDYENSHTKEIEQVDLSKIGENKSFDELISDFYLQIYGTEISDEEIAVMKEIAKEAGVAYEAD
ncbi:MAG: exonuclease SbcCD subunit D [Lachnospiraceae bacterium]|nr:exonuclease SbcCD subunit D [Lachnospiraceae bacterium]